MAAPTAGLHFDEKLLSRLRYRGVKRANVTLHVGLGTFLPIKTEDVKEHTMHSEYAEVRRVMVLPCFFSFLEILTWCWVLLVLLVLGFLLMLG